MGLTGITLHDKRLEHLKLSKQKLPKPKDVKKNKSYELF